MATREGTNITVNIPDILMGHARKEVEARKQSVAAAYSMGDLIRDALRGMLTGGPPIYKDAAAQNFAVEPGPLPGQKVKLSAQELAEKFGVKLASNMEVVEPRMDPDSGFSPGTQVTTEGQQPVPGASEDETQIRNFKAEFGAEATKRMLQQRGQKGTKGMPRLEDIKATAYMCGTDVRYELQDPQMFGSCRLTPNENYARTEWPCTKVEDGESTCGVAEVEVRFVRWIVTPTDVVAWEQGERGE